MPLSPRDDGRLLTINDANHSAALWIMNIIGLIIILMSAAYRLLQRRKLWSVDSYDDHLAAATFIFAVVYFGLLLAATSLGLGHAQAGENKARIMKAATYAFASRILCAAIVCTSQCSVLSTLGRIVNVRRDGWICLVAVGFSGACFIACLLMYTINCNSQSAISGIQNNACLNAEPRILAISILTAVNDVIPLVLAVYFIHQLQMSSQQRWYALAGYIFRVLNIVLMACSAVYTLNFIKSGRSSIDIVTSLVLQDLLVVSEFLSVVAIYLARAMNEFQTAGPAITLSSAREYSGKRTWLTGGSKTGDSKMGGSSMKLKVLGSNQHSVQNHISHVDRDNESENSQMGIMKSIQYEVTVDGQNSAGSAQHAQTDALVLDIEPDEGGPRRFEEGQRYPQDDYEPRHGNLSQLPPAHIR